MNEHGVAAIGLPELARRYELDDEALERLGRLHALLVRDPRAPTALRDPQRVTDDHLADSLVALEIDGLSAARSVADVGSGPGLPGLPLAIALPQTHFVLVESNGRKCAFIAQAVALCHLANVEVVQSRIESWVAGRGRFDAALFRAVAPLEVVVEYGAPLLRPDGRLIVWRGTRDLQAEQRAGRAAAVLGLRPDEVRHVTPYAAARDRYLHLFSRVRELPPGYPRRPGVAAKRPLGRS